MVMMMKPAALTGGLALAEAPERYLSLEGNGLSIDLEQLDRELGLDEDPLDEYDELDDGDLIAIEFQDRAAQLNLDTLTRRDVRHLKELIRDHPGVDDILDTWIHDRDDNAADVALEALAETWGIPVPLDGHKAASVSLKALEDHLAECSWPGCTEPRKERQGSRGRYPRHCHLHAVEKKRKDDRERIAAKRAGAVKLRECCQDWVKSGHRGKCLQCRQWAAASQPPYPLSAIEAAYLGAGGFHLT